MHSDLVTGFLVLEWDDVEGDGDGLDGFLWMHTACLVLSLVFNQEKRELRERLELSEKQLLTQQSEVETQALQEVDDHRKWAN